MAGLQTARALRAKGFEVTVFESAPNVGGVWRENYLNFGIQVPKEVSRVEACLSEEREGKAEKEREKGRERGSGGEAILRNDVRFFIP